jgi:phosphoribosylformylglycinamidine synthase
MRQIMIDVGMAVDGGKDSLSMATMVDGEPVKSPRELVISVYAPVPDLTKKVTPDLKTPGASLYLIDLAQGNARLGGSALAQTFGKVGSESPDVADSDLIKRAFNVVQELIGEGLISAGHDRSDGGLVTTLLEMAFSGNCGLEAALSGSASVFEVLFAEELGLVVEARPGREQEMEAKLEASKVPFVKVASSTAEKNIIIRYNGEVVLNESMLKLRSWWEETSYQLERLQINPACAEEENQAIYDRKGPQYHVGFTPEPAPPEILQKTDKPKVAILREEGSNSDREMTSAFWLAGFEPYDICMKDLLNGAATLDGFRGLAAVGGFSHADVPDSAKGWAATILFNERLKKMFDDFYNRPDTFSFGACNGCQLFGLLGWVPGLGLAPEHQPRFVHNLCGRFESRWVMVKLQKSRAIMFKGMEGLVFGVHVDHGEGRLLFPDPSLLAKVKADGQTPMLYVDDDSQATEKYPFNPNGSIEIGRASCRERVS